MVFFREKGWGDHVSYTVGNCDGKKGPLSSSEFVTSALFLVSDVEFPLLYFHPERLFEELMSDEYLGRRALGLD